MLKYCLIALLLVSRPGIAMDSADLMDLMPYAFNQQKPILYTYYSQGHSQATSRSAGYCDEGMVLYKFAGKDYGAAQNEGHSTQTADENWQCVGLGVKYD